MNLLSDISTWKHTLNLAGATNHEQLTVEILAGILRQVLVQELLGVHQPNYEAFVAHTNLDYVREASKFRQNKYYDSELGNVMPLALRGPIFPRHFPKATEGEFVPIVHLYNMSGMEYGSITQNDGAIFSLTARDLQNHKITLFSSSGRGPVGFLWA